MATIDATGGRSAGKKSLNVIFNLVPFIDLLTCLVCFLLMTAVWVQLGKISVTLELPNPEPSPPPETSLVLAIGETGFLLSENGRVVADVNKTRGDYDFSRLGVQLGQLRQKYPNHKTITVMVEDGVRYEIMVDAMDVCLANRFDDISVSGAG